MMISKALLKWHRQHGRYNLPWQPEYIRNNNAKAHTSDPYPIWLAEIMLQQTQVQTVIPYFGRFMNALPNINALANADQDKVLYLWSGLGYYRRAHYLYQTAHIINTDYAGNFPESIEKLQALPGIGKSTAGAIRAAAFGKKGVILDGNVKRVLTRYHAIALPPSNTLDKKLWQLSADHTPTHDSARYNQAIIDLGATICIRKQPQCTRCPLNKDCLAYKTQQSDCLPITKNTSILKKRSIYMLMLINKHGAVLLEKRPASGVWPQLWSLPEFEQIPTLSLVLANLRYGSNQIDENNCLDDDTNIQQGEYLPEFNHRFTHFILTIKPVLLHINKDTALDQIHDNERYCWYKLSAPQDIGMPQPVRNLLTNLIPK